MATIFRVKRRIDEDPAEALKLYCKKQKRFEPDCRQSKTKTEEGEQIVKPETEKNGRKSSNSDDSYERLQYEANKISEKASRIQKDKHGTMTDLVPHDKTTQSLSFAGTVKSKNEAVSKHVKAAISRKKIFRDMHPQISNPSDKHNQREKLSERLRDDATVSSRSNRYKVTCSHRAINLDSLDEDRKINKEVLAKITQPEMEKANNSDVNSTEKGPCPVSVVTTSESIGITHCDGDSETSPSNVIKEDKMFCLFDVENEDEPEVNLTKETSSSCGITVNGQPMVSSRAPRAPRAPLAESEYVYDLYYTHSSLSDLDLEAVLTVEALCGQLLPEAPDGADRDLIYEDEDDSNDESNWRNDYPDEDPHFFENEEDDDPECYYTEDMNYKHIVDDGDMLANYMQSRCRLGDDSDTDEKDYEESDSENELDGFY